MSSSKKRATNKTTSPAKTEALPLVVEPNPNYMVNFTFSGHPLSFNFLVQFTAAKRDKLYNCIVTFSGSATDRENVSCVFDVKTVKVETNAAQSSTVVDDPVTFIAKTLTLHRGCLLGFNSFLISMVKYTFATKSEYTANTANLRFGTFLPNAEGPAMEDFFKKELFLNLQHYFPVFMEKPKQSK